MKKLVLCFVLVLVGLLVVSCEYGGGSNQNEETKVSVIMPTGTPALGLAEYAVDAKDNENITVDVVAGSDPLMAAFVNKSYNVIVAPVNLGAKMFKQYEEYVLYSTFVWGNLYIASKTELNSFKDLDGKTVVAFGKNSTPDIVMKALLKHHSDINVTLEYVTDVSEANTLLAGNQDKIIVTAEPSISKLKSKFNLSIIDLQEEWANMTGNDSYPQAGIFVQKDALKNKTIKEELEKMKSSVLNAIENPTNCAEKAVLMHTSFETLGKEVLISAIPNCHYQIVQNEKEAVNYYLQMMIDLGFGKQMGESLPKDEFFA